MRTLLGKMDWNMDMEQNVFSVWILKRFTFLHLASPSFFLFFENFEIFYSPYLILPFYCSALLRILFISVVIEMLGCFNGILFFLIKLMMSIKTCF